MLSAFCCQDCSCSWTRPHSPHSSRRRPVRSSRYVTAARRPFNARGGLGKHGSAGEWNLVEARASLDEGLFCFLPRAVQPDAGLGEVLLFETAPGKFRLQPYDNRHYLENSRRRSAPLPQTPQGHEA